MWSWENELNNEKKEILNFVFNYLGDKFNKYMKQMAEIDPAEIKNNRDILYEFLELNGRSKEVSELQHTLINELSKRFFPFTYEYGYLQKTAEKLKSEIFCCAEQHITDELYFDNYKDAFLNVDVSLDDDGEYINIEVRCECSYDDMVVLSNKLDKIVQNYDEEAYFDMVDAGIIEAKVLQEIVGYKFWKQEKQTLEPDGSEHLGPEL